MTLRQPQVFTVDEMYKSLRQGVSSLGVAPPGKLQVSKSDTVRVTATIEYKGPAYSDYFYAAIGVRGVGFDEKAYGQTSYNFGPDSSFKTYTMTADISMSGVAEATNYDLYCKLRNNPGIGLPEVDNCIDVVGSQFQNFTITDYSKV